jgi:hypothetical protein
LFIFYIIYNIKLLNKYNKFKNNKIKEYGIKKNKKIKNNIIEKDIKNM